MAILAGSGANADVAEESVMHPIIEAGIMMTRTRPRRNAGRARLVWGRRTGPPDRAAGQGRRTGPPDRAAGQGRRTGPPGAAAAAWSSALADPRRQSSAG